jgi:RNA polymerase sigma factor (sigma-70 family)
MLSGGSRVESWQERLTAGDVDAAWKDFSSRYSRLIVATIRRTLGDDADADEVLAEVYAHLSRDRLARLTRYGGAGGARFSTWLVTVVSHLTIDWVRSRDGRHRFRPPPGLSDLQKNIFQLVFLEHRSHVEAYEVVHQRFAPSLSFGEFTRELSNTYRIVEAARGRAATRYFGGPPDRIEQEVPTVEEALLAAESGSRISAALAILPPDEQLAVKLFVVNEMKADRVAAAVGWPNAKSVYNRVYRALAQVRKELERVGVRGPSD